MREYLRKIKLKYTPVVSLLIYFLAIGTWAKLILANLVFFNKTPGLIFLIFTLSSTILIYFWTLLLKRGGVWAALAVSFVSSFIIWADVMYFRYFGSLIKVEALFLAGQINDVTSSVTNLISLWDILFFLDIVVVIFVFLKFRHKLTIKRPRNPKAALALLALSVTLITGVLALDNKSGQLDNFINRNFDMNLIEMRYGVFGAHGINTYRFFSDVRKSIDDAKKQEIVDWVNENKYQQTNNELSGIASGKDIFVIQIESLESFVIGLSLEGKEVTPNLNKLITESRYFPNGGSEFGGGKTSDSDFTANTSIYPLPDSSVFVRFGKNNFTSLPKALRSNGYRANAYHAYKRDFWNRGLAFNSLGYDHFYAADEYEEGENIILGLNDESFYRQTLEKIPAKSPSFNYLVSLSSHHPFDMAPEFQLLDIPFDEEKYDYRTYHYLQAIHYADNALGIFLDGLKEKGLYEDGLIVVYGDHPAVFGNLEDKLVRSTLGDAIKGSDLGKVPYMFKLPQNRESVESSARISQVDIMPTILNLVGIKTEYPMLGSDVLGGVRQIYEDSEAREKSYQLIRYNLFSEFY